MTLLLAFNVGGLNGFISLIINNISVFCIFGTTRQYAWSILALDLSIHWCRCIHGGDSQYDCMLRNCHKFPCLCKDLQAFFHKSNNIILHFCYQLGTLFDVKGNFHLYATTDGKERKFVIGKNRPEYFLIQSVGPANLTVEMLRQMVEKYL